VGVFESVLNTGGLESANEDAVIVRDFIYSRDMVRALDERLGIRSHYESGEFDTFSRMDPDGSLEDFLEYFRDMVAVGIDSTTNISTLRVSAFDPETSNKIAQTIIELSEVLVNRLSDRIVNDSLQFARSEVENAENRVRQATASLTQFRTETNSINPNEETTGVFRIITELETHLATTRAELLQARSYMQDSSPQVRVLQGKVDALERQVASERRRLSNEESSSDYTRLIDNFEPLLLEKELATQQYSSTLASMELARIEAQRKQRYLLPFIPPQVPDEAVEPKRLKSIITIFLGLCIIYAIGALVWAAIKDHMRL
jgi:capsular polysaccharide transport system permease protein